MVVLGVVVLGVVVPGVVVPGVVVQVVVVLAVVDVLVCVVHAYGACGVAVQRYVMVIATKERKG